VHLYKGECERVAEWNQFGRALRRLNTRNLSRAQDRPLRRITTFNQLKHFKRGRDPTLCNRAPFGRGLSANINHGGTPVASNMCETLLFHALILTVWRCNSSCGARKWMQADASARGHVADLLRDHPERITRCERRCLMAPLAAREAHADPTRLVAIKISVWRT
jgi:hypothetical protein